MAEKSEIKCSDQSLTDSPAANAWNAPGSSKIDCINQEPKRFWTQNKNLLRGPVAVKPTPKPQF